MFYKCINSLKLSILHNKKGFILENNKTNLELLKVFLKLKIINFVQIKEKNLVVFINYTGGKPIFKNIVNLYKPGHKTYISLKNLKRVSYKYNWIIILSTSKGILNNFEAINKNVGGLILGKMWN